jgi:hypothetical protein
MMTYFEEKTGLPLHRMNSVAQRVIGLSIAAAGIAMIVTGAV